MHNLDLEGRGIAVYVRSDIEAERSKLDTVVNSSFNEAIWINITMNSSNLLLGCIYRSPHPDARNCAALIKTMEDLTSGQHRFILVGDFNYSTINWANINAPGVRREDRTFHEAVIDNLLYQHVDRPTRYRVGQNPTRDDLVISSDGETVNNINYYPPLGKSDHICMIISVSCKVTLKDLRSKNRILYHRGNYEQMRMAIRQVNWDELLNNCDTSAAWLRFKDIVLSLVKKFIPSAASNVNRRRKAPYLNRDAMDKVKEKNRAWKTYIKEGTPESHERFANLRNELRHLTRQQKSNFEEQLAIEAKGNPKAFWNYVRSKSSTKEEIPVLSYGGRTGTTNVEKAEMLNDFFSSVLVNEPLHNLPQLDDPVEIMEDITISTETVLKKLLALNPNKSAGPDGIHGRVLKELANEVAVPLTTIFTRSLEEGVIPQDWREARVTPIYKRKGSKQDPSNYRPISLTCVTGKILESFVREAILEFVCATDQLSEQQHGFLPGKSCTTNLIEAFDEWTLHLENKRPVDVIYVDFRKAFDTVPHERLLIKLKSLGVSERLLRWIRDFLNNRSMRVVVNGEESHSIEVKSGIPQGSVLGPTLFVLYVNDLPKECHSPCGMLADDLKVYRAVSTLADNHALQNSLNNVCSWCATWLLGPNPDKCAILHLGTTNRHYQYYMEIEGRRTALAATECEKDLGIHVDTELSFQIHTREVVNKANRTLMIIKRSISSRHEEVIKKLFTTLVRPHLEYCSQALIFKNKAERVQLEKVQRRATKMIRGLQQLPYVERLERLKLQSLSYRRSRGDMIQVYKYKNGLSKGNIERLLPQVEGRPRETRGHTYKLKKTRSRTERRRLSFTQRVTNPWNGLSEATVSAPTLNCFKSRLDKEWLNHRFTTD